VAVEDVDAFGVYQGVNYGVGERDGEELVKYFEGIAPEDQDRDG
jgi:hypothetical protein